MVDKVKFWVSVNLILLQGERVLLLKRQNTGFADGQYHVPAGCLEDNENVTAAMIREADEEIGIKLFPEHLKVAAILQEAGGETGGVAFYFLADRYEGEIFNKEPEKCAELSFFELSNLPDNLLASAKIALANFKNGLVFQEI